MQQSSHGPSDPSPPYAAPLVEGQQSGSAAAAGPLPWSRALALISACVAGAALSLLAPWALAFDPQVWVLWGRDALALSLDTDAGPSWKPLAVLITTALAPAGSAAGVLWLLVARTGGLLAIAGAVHLGSRLGGRAAGAVAALVLLASPWWLLHTALGNSEGLLAAAVLWGFIAHLDRRHGTALALALAAGLLRPETWPFLAAYVVWTWRTQPSLRGAAAAMLATVAALWLLPDLLGGGGAVRAVGGARGIGAPDSAQHAAIPGLAVLVDAAEQVTLPGLAAAAAALVPWRAASAPVRAIGLAALAYVVLVAIATQAGYAGNPRYLAPASALGAVLAGIGAARLGHLTPWGTPVALAAFTAAIVALQVHTLRTDVRELGWRASQRTALNGALVRAGGVPALRACGEVRTAHLTTRALVAWRFELGLRQIDDAAAAPGVLLRSQRRQRAALEPRVPRGFTRVASAPGWEIWTACRRGADYQPVRGGRQGVGHPTLGAREWSRPRRVLRASLNGDDQRAQQGRARVPQASN